MTKSRELPTNSWEAKKGEARQVSRIVRRRARYSSWGSRVRLVRATSQLTLIFSLLTKCCKAAETCKKFLK